MGAPKVQSPVQLPSKQKAVMPGPDNEMAVRDDVPIPELEEGQVLIKTKAVALNPVDTKMIGPFLTPGCTYGTDCAGEVIALGSGVTALKIGDRVTSAARGMDKDRPYGGAFCEYVPLLASTCIKIPDGMSYEDGASLTTAMASAAMAIFWAGGIDTKLLKQPAEKPATALVYGGSSATGTMMIQVLKMSVQSQGVHELA